MEFPTIIIEEIQNYTPEIAESIRQLVKQLDDHYHPLTESDVKAMIADNSTHLLLARHRKTNKIVGMITVVTYRIPYKKKAWLEDLVVDQASRGQGIGSALIKQAVEVAKDEGVASVNLTSQPLRESANELYQRLGFEKRNTNVYRMNL